MKWLTVLVIFMLISIIWSFLCTQPGPCVCNSKSCMCRECPSEHSCNADNGKCYPIDKSNYVPCESHEDCGKNGWCNRGICW